MNIKCNGCGSEGLSKYLSFKDLDLYQCKHCELVFSEKIPTNEVIKDYYQEGFYDEKGERFIKPFEMVLYLSRYFRILAIKRFCKKNGKMVDLGFSRGITMRLLSSSGWHTF